MDEDGHSKVREEFWEECSALFGEDIILCRLPQDDDPKKGKFYELYIPEERLPDSFDEQRPWRRQISVNGFKARYSRIHVVKPRRGKNRHFWIFGVYVP